MKASKAFVFFRSVVVIIFFFIAGILLSFVIPRCYTNIIAPLGIGLFIGLPVGFITPSREYLLKCCVELGFKQPND